MYGSQDDTQVGSAPLLGSDDLDDTMRRGFIRKVFGILAAQLITTFMISVPFLVYQDSTTAFLANNQWVPILCMVSLLGSCLVLCCAPQLMRRFPTNYAILSLFTVAEGVLVGTITLAYKTESVMIVFGITAAVVVALMVFATCTNIDFTGMAIYLYVALIVFMLIGLKKLNFGSIFQTVCGRKMFLLPLNIKKIFPKIPR